MIDIKTPNIVLGAMYGDAGIVIPFNAETGERTGQEYQAFLKRGKMIRPHWKEPENTRISALITLRHVHVGAMRFQKYVSQLRTNAVGRVERAVDICAQISAAKIDFDRGETHLGVIVWENAFASNPFPRDLFCGEYDETWGVENGSQRRVFAGKGILAYEEIAASFHRPTLFDIVKKKDSGSEKAAGRKKRRWLIALSLVGLAALWVRYARNKSRRLESTYVD